MEPWNPLPYSQENVVKPDKFTPHFWQTHLNITSRSSKWLTGWILNKQNKRLQETTHKLKKALFPDSFQQSLDIHLTKSQQVQWSSIWKHLNMRYDVVTYQIDAKGQSRDTEYGSSAPVSSLQLPPDVVVKYLRLLLYTKIPGSNLSPATGYSEGFWYFSGTLRAN